MASLPPTPSGPEPAGTHSYTLQPTMATPPPPLQPSESGKVEGQPNGDTIPVEQANPTDDTVAGAGSLQNDQIVQKIEEVLSGALDTEPQCKSDVDKNTVKNSSQSTKRSSTGEDEIPKKKSKKNKKHKSKKKKKKKKKRKKEKKHKKQPKESKLSTHQGEQGAVQPASLLMPETSSSKLSVQHGGFGDANLAVHVQPQELCLKASEALDRQVLGLVPQQPAENLGSDRGTLCATNPPFNLEGSQSDTPENTSITQTRICTIQEQINQSHQSIYPVTVNASDQGVLVDTGNYNLSSVPYGVANKSESHKANLASEVIEAQRGSEVLLKSVDTEEVKTLGTVPESETMEVLEYSEAPLQSVAQMGAKVLEATSWASDVTTISQSASHTDLNTVKVAHMSMTMEETKIPEGTEKSLLMGNVTNVERSLELGDVSRTLEPSLKPSVVSYSLSVMQCSPAEGSVVSKADASLQHPFEIPATAPVTQVEIRSAKTLLGPEAVTEVKDVEPPRSSLQETVQPVAVVKSMTLETVMEPVGITAADVQAAQECLQVGVIKAVEGTAADPATVQNASGVSLQPKVLTETRSVDRTQESATLQLENTNASKISESALKTVVVSETKDSEGSSLLRRPEELRESRSESELNVRGLEATPLSLQKEDREGPGGVPRQMIVVEGAEDTVQYGTAARAVSDAGLQAMEVGSIRPVRSLETTVGLVSDAEGKTSSSHLHMKDIEYQMSLAAAKAQALEAILQLGTPAVSRENVSSEVKMVGSKALEASQGFTALEERSERTPESVVARVGMEPVRPSEALAGMMHLKSTAEREPKHAEPLGASKANLLGVEGAADVRGVKVSSQMSHLPQMKNLEMILGSETRTLRHSELASEDPNQSKAISKETVLAAVQTLEASSEPVQEQVLGHSVAVLESLPRGEEKTMDSEILTEGRNLKGALESKILTDVRTQGPTVEYIIATKRTSTQRNEPSLIKEKLEAASETEEAVEARDLEPASEARDVGLLHSMKEPEAVEVKGSVHMVIQGLETSQKSVNVGAINVLECASEAIPESLHTENQEHLQAVLEAKPAAGWKSTEEASQILSAAETVSSEAVPKPGDTKDLGKTVDHAVAEVQHAEGVQDQPMEDVRVPGQAQECEMLVEQKDAEQAQVSEPLIAETVFSSSHAVDEKASTGTPDSEMIRETQQVEGAPAHLGETKDLETAALPETVAEVKDAEAVVGLEAETKDLEAAEVPEAIAEAVPAHVVEASQSEVTPQTEAVREATPEQESEKRDSETSEVQPDVAARMRETLMRLEKVEKSSHRTSDKKHDAKKQKRSRSKSQSRSRKRKKKSRSRSTSRRLTSKRGRSRSRNYSVSRKKHSKSRSRSVEKRERRLSSRRSRRRRSRSSDRYRSKSRSAEKRLSSGRSRRRRSRSSDRYRSKSGSVDKRLSSRRSGRRRSRSSDRYRSKSGSVDKRLSSRRSGRRRSRSSDRYRSKSRSVDKRLSSRRSGRRHSRSSERYRSKSLSVDKRGSRLSSWRSRRRRSRSSDRSKSRSRSSEKRGGKEYSWRFRNRSVSSDRSKSRSRSVEKRGRKSSLRRSKRRRSKSSDRYKSRSRSAEKRDRKQSSRKSKRQRSKSSDRYKSRSKSVEKKKESSRKSKRRRSKSSDRYKSRSRSVEKKRKESSKKSKRKRSKSSDSVKSRSKSVEKRDSKLSSVKGSSKRMESSELQESTKCPETVDVPEPPSGSEGTSSKSSNGPMSVTLSAEGLNGPELPPASESGLPKPSDSLEQNSSPAENTVGLQPSVMSEFDPDDHVPKCTPVEESQVSVLSMTSENGSTDKAVVLESSSLPELAYSTPTSVSLSVEKEGDAETPSVTEFQLSASASHDDELRSTSLKETEGPEPHLTLESGCSGSSDDYKTISMSSGKNEIQESSLMSDSVLSDLSDGHELRHTPVEKAELQNFLEVPESVSSNLAGSPQSLSFETAEAQKSFLAPQVPCSVFPESASLPIETGQMQEPSLASESGCFKSLDGHGSGSCVAARIPLISEDGSFTSPDENEEISLSVEKIKASAVSMTSECGPVEISDVVLTAVGQSCKSSEVLDSVSSVDKDIDGPTLSQVLHCSESSEVHELRYLPDGKIESTGSFLISKSGIPVGHDGHKANHNYLEKTEGADLLLASEIRHSLFPEGYKLTSTPVEKTEIQKSPLPLESEFSNSVNVCESVSTPNEKLQAPVTSVTSEGGLFLLSDSHELRPFSAENAEVQKSPRVECIASTDGYSVRSSYDEEIQVQEPSLILEGRCAVSSDGHDLTFTASEKAEVEEPSQMSENEYTTALDGPELTSTPTERAEMRELYHTPEENCSVSIESQKFHSALAEQIEMQEPGLMPENEHTVYWKAQELRYSSPEKVEMQEASVVATNEYAVSSELPSSLAEKAEVQECSLLSENEYTVSPEIQDTSASPEKEVQEPSMTSDSQYTIVPEDQGLQSTLAERTLVQEPSLIVDSQYAASPEGQELLSAHAEKAEVQDSSLLSENEYVVSPEGHDMRPSPVGKEEMEEHSETSESESSMSTDSQELQSTAAGKTEVQELSLMSEGECAMSPQGQGLQSSPTEEAENECALSPEEYESRLTHAEKIEGMDSSLTSENDHVISFESQEARFTPVQRVDAQELSPIPEIEHEASPGGHELGFHTEPLMLNSRASMSPDHSDMKSIPVENTDDAVPESARSMSPDCYSVKSGPGEEAGDVEPSLISERRHSTSSYQESHEPKSPMEEEGPEPSLTSERRHSTSPDDHESRSSVGEEAEYLEQPLTTERRSSVSSDEHESRSTTGEEVEDAEPSLTAERRDSTSSDEHESRSATGEDVEDREPSLTGERRHSTSSDDRESRSTTGEEMEDLEPSLTAEHRRSVSPDGRESRSSTGEEAEDQELSLTAERRHSTSSDEHESRSTAGEDAEDVEPSLTAERRDSTSSDDRESRSTAGEEGEDMEQSLTTEHRRSTSPDGRESRSTTGEEGDDMEPSSTAERRDSTSSDEHESRSSTGEEGEDAETSVGDEDKQGDEDKLERLEEEPDSRRSESSEREKSRSKSVDKISDKGSSRRSISRHSRSPTRQKSRSTSVEKGADKESSWRSRHRRSRSTSVEKTADKESSQRSRHRRSRSAARQRSRSASVEKAADKESRRSRRRRSRSTAHQRSRSKSVEKAADKESRRSRSRRSRSSQRRSQRYDTRRNRSRSATRRRASRSKSNRRSRSSSLSRSRHRRRSRSRSASRRRRSLSRDRRKRSQRNRSRSTDRRRRRSDSRDRRISLRLRSRSRTPIRQRRSRSRGRRRSSSRSPIRLRRSRSSGRRRYSRSPDRRRSRSSEFSSRSPKRLTDLDKAQLLEIAKANAAAMCAKSGVPLPPSLMPLLSQKKDDKANQKSSRDTLKELTEKCKKIAQSTDDVIVNKPHVSDEEEEERPFYHHPFKLSEPKPIFFNLSTPSIKPAPPPQPKNQVSLSKEFPVSSGSQHRKKEADSVYGEWVPVEKGKEDSKDDVFPKPAIECVDITTAMNDRAIAQKRLNENTFDLEAMCMLNRAQEQIDAWAQSNSIPGQFTGSTGAQILSSDELTNSGPQAWIRKDQFLRAAPVTGGMGAQLMRKMGWREGEGLGKNKEGSVEPIMVDFKTDRKGLVAVGEKAQKRSGHYVVMKDLSGKHPVSALMEICNKRRWTPPEFVLVDDSGPDHRKHFIFKVRVNGNEYRPTFASLNKKHAKATAATAALQAMGLVPKESMVNTTMFRSASHR